MKHTYYTICSVKYIFCFVSRVICTIILLDFFYLVLTDCARSPKDKRSRESRDSEHRTNHDRSSTEVSILLVFLFLGGCINVIAMIPL